jgi:endonuclease/exonuclease/phosphatase family metal-dependent hydrolase
MRNGAAAALVQREDRGNAILTTEALLDIKAIELPFGKQRRVALTAIVQGMAGPPVRVITAHFDSNDHRVAQATALSDRITFLLDVPIVVGADVNARRGSHDGGVLGIANRVPLLSCGTGRTNRWPLRLDVLVPIGRLDFMFATATPNTTMLRHCETLGDAYGSDHLPLLMTLQY